MTTDSPPFAGRIRAALLGPVRGGRSTPAGGRGVLEGSVLGTGLGLAAILAKSVLVVGSGGDVGFVLYVAAIALAAWFRGLAGGIAATLVTGLTNTYLFQEPGLFLPDNTTEQVRLLVFLGSGLVVGGLFQSLRVERDELTSALREEARLARKIVERDERLEVVLASSRTGIWEVDLVNDRYTWSAELYEQFRRDPTEGPGPLTPYVHPDDRPGLDATIERAVATRGAFMIDLRLALPTGEERWTHVRGRPFYEGGRAVRLLGTSEDITERVEVEQRQAALAAQEMRALEFQRAFIDVLSHELRTPMTTIFAAAEMLRRPGSSLTDADRWELLGDIHEETRRLDGLIENLLVLSRAERSTLEVMTEPVDLRRAIEAAIRQESSRWPRVTFTAAIDRALPIASGSDGYVGRVLANLLSNAGKYVRPDGLVAVRATADGEEVVVRVIDDGVGIDVDPARLFELFYRAPTASKHASGSGIGLFVSARLTEAMGGRIWGSARPSGGAEFGFALRRFESAASVHDGGDRDDDSHDRADGNVETDPAGGVRRGASRGPRPPRAEQRIR